MTDTAGQTQPDGLVGTPTTTTPRRTWSLPHHDPPRVRTTMNPGPETTRHRAAERRRRGRRPARRAPAPSSPATTPGSPTRTWRRCEADLVVVQHLRVLDVRRAQRRRLRHGRLPVRARHRQLAGARRAHRRHRHRAGLLQPRRQAEPEDGRALPGHQPRGLRRARRQHPRDHPRPHRGRLVRRADVPRRRGAEHHLPQVHPELGGSCWRRASSGCRRSAGSPTRSSGSPRRPCSGRAWRPSASSSTGPVRPSTS